MVMSNDLQQPALSAAAYPASQRPYLIFTCELEGPELLALFDAPHVLDTLERLGCGVALGLPTLSPERAEAARLLKRRGVSVVAWLTAPAEEGFAFNAQNYPLADDRYELFRAWVSQNQLDFDAIGLEVSPPSELMRMSQLRPGSLTQRLLQARDTTLYLAARAAYTELISTMHHDGYEVHTYQLPIVADDRRAGTTLVQRALDVVDLPADLDVLLCSSGVPIERLGGDLGGALVASYGPGADAIAVGDAGSDDDLPPLPWASLRRDLLLAAQYTDTIYVDSLEDCARRGFLPSIAALDWGARPRVSPAKRAVVAALRGTLWATLIVARFGPRALGWLGWLLAAGLWLRGRRGIRR